MKAVVIGGGITGCLSALELIERGFEVTIFEASPRLGGILRDITVNEKIFSTVVSISIHAALMF